jgi:capsular polysaccharide export protein
MGPLLEQVDEVHTLTSLTGFEALLRGKKVATYGLPFYAGWGLTEDSFQCPRRNRPLKLEELVAGALILYPVYVDPLSRQVCTAEHLLEWLARNRGTGEKPSLLARLVRLLK